MSLTTCLRKAGTALSAEDKGAILALSRKYRSEGLSAEEAGVRSVEEHLAAVEAKLADAEGAHQAAQPEQQASKKAPAQTGGRRARGAAWDRNPLRYFLATHGISLEHRKQFAPGQTEQRSALVPGIGPIFKKTGLAPDELAIRAVEEGFLLKPDQSAMADLIHRALAGERIIPQYAEGAIEQEAERLMQQHREAEEAIADLPDAAVAELAENDDDIPWGDVESNVTMEAAMRSLGFTEEEIRHAVETAEGAGRAEEAGAGDRGAGEAPAGQAQRADRAREGAPGAEEVGLTAPTKQDVLAQQQRREDGERSEAKRKADDASKSKADAQRGEFTLTGSDRAADANPDQRDAFDSPAQGRRDGEKNLIVQHNITAENVLHVDRMGGLAVPSLAITKVDQPLENFGEITLLGDQQMATPSRDTKVFGADIYSPRYPQVSYKLTESQWKRMAEALKPYREEGDGESRWSVDSSDLLESLTHHKPFQRMAANKRGVDWKTIGYHDLRSEATQFLKDLGAQERLFQGYTYSGNRRYVEHTLDRVVKVLKKELRGGENFNYGAGSLRAKLTPQFRTIEAIRRSKDKLMTAESFDKLKDEINKELLDLSHDMVPDGGFRATDTAMGIMEDAAKMGLDRAAKSYDVELSPEMRTRVAEFMTKLRDLPTAYFEAKVLRAMDLGEFKAAVVPSDIRPEVRTILERKGLTVTEYKKGDAADRARAVKAAAEATPDGVFKRGDAPPKNAEEALAQVRARRGISVTDARKIVDQLTANWKNGPKVTVVSHVSELPGEDNPDDVRGLYTKGHVYIVAGAHRNGADVKRSLARTLAHEAIAHHGLRNMLGREAWHRLMKNIQLAIDNGNKPLTEIRDYVRKAYEDANLSPALEADEIAARAVELAVDEDGNFKPGFGFFKEVWAKVAQFLRDIGITVKFTNAELHGMLVLAMRNLEAGQRTAGGATLAVASAREEGPMHHRAFHGSPHDFDRFTTEKMGTGEGAQAFGWGMYFAENQGVAESYRRTLTTAVQYKGEGIAGWAQTHRAEYLAMPDITRRTLAWVRDYPSVNEAYTQAIVHDETAIEAEIQRLIRSGDLHNAPPGRLYEVHIPDGVVAKMLLWDKPLSEQPEGVAAAVNQALQARGFTSAQRDSLRQRDATGAEIYRALTGMHGQEQSSKLLAKLGIPGIKFLDGQSRNRPLKDIKKQFLAELPEDADFDEVLDLIGSGTFSPKNEAILKALAENDWLGFDYPAQAISAALSDRLANFDASPELVKAVADAQVDATHNLVVFKDEDVQITHKDGSPVTKAERDDFLEGAHARKADAFDGEQHARAAATGNQTTPTATAAPRPLSRWRDATGRVQFAPGQALYDLIGKAADPVLTALQMKAATPTLRRALREMKNEVRKAQETAAAVAHETNALTAAEREMVSDIIERELAAGTVPPAHAVRLATLINDVMGRQTDELVRLGMLTQESADRWRDAYLPRFYESKLTRQAGDAWTLAVNALRGRPRVMAGIKGKHLRGRGLYETIPESELPQWEAQGWEVRDPDYTPGQPSPDGTVQVWRDFTRQERENMGEIRDAGFRFVMGYMQTQKDVALGRMFEALAADPEVSSRTETSKLNVQVPTSIVQGTGAKTYGKLAGRWVSKDTLSHLSALEEAQSDALRMYRKAMSWWKVGKTAMNPVSHVNNVLSNLTMAHFAGVSYWDAHKYTAAIIDLARGAPMVKEGADAGLFGGSLSEEELMNILPPDLRALAGKQEGLAPKIGRTAFDMMTFFLRKPMGWAYQAEDSFFRYLIYRDARGRGMDPQDAIDYAQKFIFAYDDLPKGARMIRDFGLPFFSYTYKAAPALLHTALTHPLRMAAPAAVLWAANAAAYAIAAGGDDEDWEESLRKYLTDAEFRQKAKAKEQLEREHLPSWMKGTTALMTPKTIRLGTDELTKLPLFIDVSRIIPGGDLFDVSPNAGGLPIPQPITPSHPIFTTMVAMIGNKDLFFGKEVVDSNDTKGEAAEKRAKWLWTQLSPAIAAGNYHWQRGMNALAQATGKEVEWMPDALGGDATGIGRDGLPVQPKFAAMQTFGIKVRPIDIDKSEAIEGSMRKKMIRDIDAELRSLKRLYNLGAISPRAFDKADELARTKKDRLQDGLTVDGDKKD